jgi:hypothetical protein
MEICVARPSTWIAVLAAVAVVTLPGRIEAQSGETAIACGTREVRYTPFDPSSTKKIILSETKDSSEAPSAKDKKWSPQGTRYLLLQSADFNKPGPWTTTVFIGGAGLNGRLLKLSLIDHESGGVQVQWLNEKLLFVDVWWGRIVSVDLIVDINSRTFLYKEMAEYGDITQPCR